MVSEGTVHGPSSSFPISSLHSAPRFVSSPRHFVPERMGRMTRVTERSGEVIGDDPKVRGAE